MKRGEMDFNDMLSQYRMVKGLGSRWIASCLKMIPGLGGLLSKDALDKVHDKDICKIEAIILSMTPQERKDPDLLDVSRRQRIAAGAGVRLMDVGDLVAQLYAMRRGMRR
jgi:signal recognition particle subunit SRP54